MTLKVAPRRAQGHPKKAQGRQQTPPGLSKTIRKSTCDFTWSSKAAREAPGVPAGKDFFTKIDSNTYFPLPLYAVDGELINFITTSSDGDSTVCACSMRHGRAASCNIDVHSEALECDIAMDATDI